MNPGLTPRPDCCTTPVHRGRLRRSAALVMVALVLALSACSKDADTQSSASPGPSGTVASETPTPTPTPTVDPTALTSLDAIQVTGDLGSAPSVTGPWPATTATTMVKVLHEGSGPRVPSTSSQVEAHYYGVNARTGVTFDTSWTAGQSANFTIDQVVPGIGKALEGQRAGSRILVMMTSADGYDSAGGASSVGIQVGDSLVFVLDLIQVELTGPEGTPVTPAAGLPTVSDHEGTPTITIPAGAQPPSDLVVQPLIKGSGPAVAATDGITVNFVGVVWSSGQILETSYESGPQSGLLSDMIPGWRDGLVNQPQGSRVLLVVPPAKAYPNGRETPSLGSNETLVYVVDILFTQPAS